MNQLVKVFEGQKVRIVGSEDNPLFVLSDVCKVLEIGNPSDVKKRLEDGVVSIEVILDSMNRPQKATVINEDGLYDVIFDSRKPQAKRFRKWVTSEVLPSIRKDGGYMVADTSETPEELIARALVVANKTIERVEKEKEKLFQEKQELLHTGRTYTSTEIAKELGYSSATELNRVLERAGVQYKVNKTWVLTARYSKNRYTSLKQIVLESGHIVYDRRWTNLGREFILNNFKVKS